ncbi:hypothetical protein BDP27DRAFT_1412615 [Rhodocollybia butyracea]|uniref:Uncharacterized protein n=1 Tax=Rhodocollybia butyracea TaxID=206335 RepID=A0A9P5Q5U5_9AGAR|nr:hypothetical protein BDP27DRAFT_1412615 [Rhodocollybia butyracea]
MRFFSIKKLLTRRVDSGPEYSLLPDHDLDDLERYNDTQDENSDSEVEDAMTITDSSDFVPRTPNEESFKYNTLVDAAYCLSWPEGSHSVSSRKKTTQASFDLPAFPHLLFFIARGSSTRGHLTINTDEDAARDKIVVRIAVKYRDRADLEKTKICTMDNDSSPDEYTVESGIMVWGDEGASQDPTFNISVQVPWSWWYFQDFSTDFSAGAYSQEIGGIWDPVSFNTVRLKGDNATIKINAAVGAAFVQTTNAAVEAAFSTDNQVHIRTTKEPIDSLIQGWGWGYADDMIKVSMITSDARIQAALNIGSFGTELNASLHTSNGLLRITMPYMTGQLDTAYYINASTSNAAADVFLHPDYEGRFDLSTSENGKAKVQWDPFPELDPLLVLPDKNHSVDIEDSDDSRLVGRVFLGEQAPRNMGDITVTTTEEDVQLYAFH